MADVSRAGIFVGMRTRRVLRPASTVPSWAPARKAGLARDEWHCRETLPDGSPCAGAPDVYHVAVLAGRWRCDRDLCDLSNPVRLSRRQPARADAGWRAAR
jgi:hypothetical protein